MSTDISPAAGASAAETNYAQETGGNLATLVTNTIGVATATNQNTGNASAATTATNTGNIPAKGAATTANSTPVNIASDQTVPVSLASNPLPTGAATSANQTTEITNLSTIATNQTSGGQLIQGNIASAGTDSGNPVKVGGRYNTTAPTLTNGQRGDAQLDVNGNLKVTNATLQAGENLTLDVQGVAVKPVVSATYSHLGGFAASAVTAVAKSSPGNLMSIYVSNLNAAVRYVQIFNSTTAPSGGATPVFSFPLTAGSATVASVCAVGAEFFGENGYYLSTGITIAVSTAAATYTAATAADHTINHQYV